MNQINYKKVKCPKCGKSYFRVKENSGISFTTLAFITKPDPIYKDGELQNPTEAEPIKVRCECLECGCNFRVETHDVFGEYRFIDEEAELEEAKRKLSESCKLKMINENLETLKREAEKSKESIETLTIGDPCITESCTLNFPKSQTVAIDTKSPFVIKRFEDIVKEELDEIKERLAKLESKVLGENQ